MKQMDGLYATPRKALTSELIKSTALKWIDFEFELSTGKAHKISTSNEEQIREDFINGGGRLWI